MYVCIHCSVLTISIISGTVMIPIRADIEQEAMPTFLLCGVYS